MKTMISIMASGLALAIGFASSASADSKCSDVNIQIKNKYHDPVTNAEVDIKVIDFKYWDDEDDKWRNEATDNKRIDPRQTEVWNKNLAYVGGETGVKLKVYYKYKQAGGRWSTDHTKVSDSFKCYDGRPVKVEVN